jgi:hypothetical protein
MSKILILTPVLALLFLCSCGEKRQEARPKILSEKQMTELLVDTHLVDAILYLDNSRAEEKHDKGLFYYPSVLEKHGVTKAQMDSSVAWYMRNPAAYARIYAGVVKELENRQAKFKKKDETE